jgi:dTMP kinase
MESDATSGFFIAFEGGEGSGKSTQTKLLTTWLESQGRSVLTTRQPGGTEVGATLRSILLDPATGDIAPRTEALIYLADKAEHAHKVLRPALASGHVVVTDRYIESMLAYQGAGRDLSPNELGPIAQWATNGLNPDLTIVLDIDPVVGLKRAGEPDRIEAEPIEFHQRVRQFFLDVAADSAAHVVISAAQTTESIHAQIIEIVTVRLAARP